MKETSIIFSTNSVKAILDEIKTQTRRTYGLSLLNDPPQNMADWQLVAVFQDGCARFATPDGNGDVTLVCPYGGYGDRLCVKETFCKICYSNDGEPDVCYKEDLERENQLCSRSIWSPSIHMPRWASRITLEITEVRVERLQEITWEDSHKEGILRFHRENPDPTNGGVGYNRGAVGLPMRYESVTAFRDLWDSLNAKRGYGWEVNPWVWVISFRRL